MSPSLSKVLGNRWPASLSAITLIMASIIPAFAGEPVVRDLPGPDGMAAIRCTMYPPEPIPAKQAGLVLHLYGAGGSHKEFNVGRPAYADFRRLLAARGDWLVVPELGPKHWMNDTACRQIDAVIAGMVRQERVDSARVHLLGASMGGGSSLIYVMHRPEKIRSVVAIFPMTDFTRWLNESPGYRALVEEAHGITAENRDETLRKISPQQNLDAFRHTPVFLLHGGKDTTVKPEHSRQFASALKIKGHAVTYREAAEETHRDEIAQPYQREMADFLTESQGDAATAEGPREIIVRRTPDKVRFGLIGEVGKTPAPTLIVIAHGIEDMQKQPVYTEVASLLAKQGWISVVIEPPCHGEDVRDGEPAQLDGWRYRLEHEGDFVSAFSAKARAVLDVLIKDGVTDPERVAVCGTSRGGWLAFHLAASDPRIKAAAGISPVTRLTALREFATTRQREKAEQLDVARLAPKLAGRAVWLSIGNNDTRVNTDDAIAFTREVVRATARPDQPDAVIPVELLVAPTPGHSKIDQAHELLAAWLINRFPAATK